ncbi:hypothetical protein ACIQNU_37510 [Streptomyces sp. NPDC091292]|uniref:hypothetical protein n=1 Tax=Streptomyces sp. NPDC091292 TaxID=3365991 RepID=UPI0037F9563C
MSSELSVGAIAYDARAKRVGVVMDDYGTHYVLRPPRGGIEWDASRADVRPATAADRLRPALTEVNERSSGGSPWG